jgi:hypothetical protein
MPAARLGRDGLRDDAAERVEVDHARDLPAESGGAGGEQDGVLEGRAQEGDPGRRHESAGRSVGRSVGRTGRARSGVRGWPRWGPGARTGTPALSPAVTGRPDSGKISSHHGPRGPATGARPAGPADRTAVRVVTPSARASESSSPA